MMFKRKNPLPSAVKERPVWVAGEARKARRRRRFESTTSRPWRMHYNLAYDGGGGGPFDIYYHTAFGARWSAFFHIHFRSFGGSAELYRNHPDR